MSHRLTSRGDTIIEALISIVIIGFVLSAAYATANHSSQNDLDSQEHEIAITIAQSQLEQLNNQTADNLAAIASAGAACFIPGQATPITGALYTSDCLNYQPRSYPEEFAVKITQTIPANPHNNQPLATFEVTVNWQGPDGPDDSVQLFYQPEGLES